MVQKSQSESLLATLREKTVHSAPRLTIEDEMVDKKATFGWLQDGRFQAVTEALIISAQLLTHHYEQATEFARSRHETIGIYCPPVSLKYRWQLYKERHDFI